jgi:Universal stress protein family
VDMIVKQAREGIDMLLIGSRAYGAVRCAIVGSTAIEVMRLAPCPVVVVLRGAEAPVREPYPVESPAILRREGVTS